MPSSMKCQNVWPKAAKNKKRQFEERSMTILPNILAMNTHPSALNNKNIIWRFRRQNFWSQETWPSIIHLSIEKRRRVTRPVQIYKLQCWCFGALCMCDCTKIACFCNQVQFENMTSYMELGVKAEPRLSHLSLQPQNTDSNMILFIIIKYMHIMDSSLELYK
jgi:hypothetical protein